jgi:hypothetical protein
MFTNKVTEWLKNEAEHRDMQFRLWDQIGVSKGLTLDVVLRQLIPVHTYFFNI